MKEKLTWFSALPFGLALRLFLLYTVRRLLRLQTYFSYSEFAEDLIISHLSTKKGGRYVDVGCNEPLKFSNTFSMYLNGWRGINIDANRELIDKCKRIRKKDISICAAVSDSERETTFYKAKNSLISTIDENYYSGDKNWWVTNLETKETVITQKLTTILDKYLGVSEGIDLLSVDVEGHDLNVLKGLEFSKYRPKIIAIECREMQKINENEIHQFLVNMDYELSAFAGLTGFYLDIKKKDSGV